MMKTLSRARVKQVSIALLLCFAAAVHMPGLRAWAAEAASEEEAAAEERTTAVETVQWVQQEKIGDPQKPMVLDQKTNPGNVKVDVLEGADPAVETQFDVALVSGDKDVVEELQVWKDWSYKVAFSPVSNAEIRDFYKTLTEALRKEGYVFA